MPEIFDLLVHWTSFLARWVHVIVAAMWIGASFYIISWENKFNRTGLREGIAGNFWTIQGGDFYYVEKLALAPSRLPEELHWFKYEAYLTWISGFCLLCTLYYFDTRALIDPTIADFTPTAGITLSFGSLLLNWWLYNLYCRNQLARNLRVSAIVGLVYTAILTYAFSRVFSQQAAFIHVGAVLGTIMAANVYFEIIPWHKRFIKAIEHGESLEALSERRPGFRSRHNHYLTLPVFFIMLSSHFPVVLGQAYSWLILPAIGLAAGLVKHAHNQIQKKQPALVAMLLAAFVFLAVILTGTLQRTAESSCDPDISFDQAYEVVSTHCLSCHSVSPTDALWLVAPLGVVLDSKANMLNLADRILERVVTTRTMPPIIADTHMPATDRNILGCWAKSSRF